MPIYRPIFVALVWMAQNTALEAVRILGVPVLRLRYEDWTQDTKSALSRIRDFAGISVASESELGPSGSIRVRADHTCSGNPLRFKTGAIEVRTDEAWKEWMPVNQRLVVSAITFPLLLAYRYSRLRRMNYK